MNLSEVFIHRPVATTLFTAGMALAGATAYTRLAVSPFPQVDSATISVAATMAGASPETMATSVATPLERHLGTIADVTEMTSTSSVGSTGITLQFGLNRDIDGAARDVEAAINAARVDLPTALRSNPTYRKQNPSDAPIMMTTFAAILGAIPLALSFGEGGEIRRPLGIAIVGGLIVSQALTLYTTPVIYLYMDRLNNWIGKFGFARSPGIAIARTDPAIS